MMRTVKHLAWLLVFFGLCPPSAINKQLSRWLEALNYIIRVVLALIYASTQLIVPSSFKEFNTKTYEVVIVLMRSLMFVHNLVALALSPYFGTSISRVLHFNLRSSLSGLVPAALCALILALYPFIWRNPFYPVENFPIIFLYFSLAGAVLVITMQTILLRFFHQQVKELNNELETVPKHPIQLEALLARVARRRCQLNTTIVDVGAGVGPIVAATVLALSVRLSFSLFINYKMAVQMFTTGKMATVASLLLTYPRTFCKAILLTTLAHAGQLLKDEVQRSQTILDGIATTRHRLPPSVTYQIAKFRMVSDTNKVAINTWGLFSIDHTLVPMIVSIVFGLLMIQVQFEVSEYVSASN